MIRLPTIDDLLDELGGSKTLSLSQFMPDFSGGNRQRIHQPDSCAHALGAVRVAPHSKLRCCPLGVV